MMDPFLSVTVHTHGTKYKQWLEVIRQERVECGANKYINSRSGWKWAKYGLCIIWHPFSDVLKEYRHLKH